MDDKYLGDQWSSQEKANEYSPFLCMPADHEQLSSLLIEAY